MAQDFIVDPENGRNVAIIRNGEVFRDDKEGAKIATLLNGNLYDLKGTLVGHLEGAHVTDATGSRLPIAFKKLVEGKS
jgi:hypothetical protein